MAAPPNFSRIRGKADSILIVGAGVFGLSTAAELSSRGYKNITVIDRYPPPVPDGSSVDISRIIRTDYADPIYHRMASEAQALWQTEWEEFYTQCGFVLLSETPNHPYIEECKQNLAKASQPFTSLANGNQAKSTYPALSGDLSRMTGYTNAAGGWANAEGAIEKLAFKCARAGVSFITGPRGTVTQLQRKGSRITGVNVVSGPPLTATHIILATGAWTSTLIPTYESVISTGQPVGFMQLTSS
jgi:sarcosine oxidase/L-pipecolate oxidase